MKTTTLQKFIQDKDNYYLVTYEFKNPKYKFLGTITQTVKSLRENFYSDYPEIEIQIVLELANQVIIFIL